VHDRNLVETATFGASAVRHVAAYGSGVVHVGGATVRAGDRAYTLPVTQWRDVVAGDFMPGGGIETAALYEEGGMLRLLVLREAGIGDTPTFAPVPGGAFTFPLPDDGAASLELGDMTGDGQLSCSSRPPRRSTPSGGPRAPR
jgi:hypothetical protein